MSMIMVILTVTLALPEVEYMLNTYWY